MNKTDLNNIVISIKEDPGTFLNFMKTKFPIFHNSNVFFRDIQYGVKSYLEKKDIKASYRIVDDLSEQIIKFLEEQNILLKIKEGINWKLNYPEFVTTTPGDPL
ncbi:MAG: hypothetical protein ACM3O3_06120 [Syntrophothermus sp.]|nr:hypothetical protein [Ignavibacteriaceae bacterium]